MGVCSLIGVLLFGACFGYAILQPLAIVRKRPKRRTQYSLADLFCLMLLLQMPFAYTGAAVHWHGASFAVTIGALLSLVVVAIWWRAVGILSQLGIHRPLRRIVLLVVVLPAAILGSVFCVPLIVAALAMLDHDVTVPVGAKLAIWTGALAILPVGFGLRRLTLWVLSAADGDGSSATCGESPKPAADDRQVDRTPSEDSPGP